MIFYWHWDFPSKIRIVVHVVSPSSLFLHHLSELIFALCHRIQRDLNSSWLWSYSHLREIQTVAFTKLCDTEISSWNGHSNFRSDLTCVTVIVTQNLRDMSELLTIELWRPQPRIYSNLSYIISWHVHRTGVSSFRWVDMIFYFILRPTWRGRLVLVVFFIHDNWLFDFNYKSLRLSMGATQK